jgi:hypothetical protein
MAHETSTIYDLHKAVIQCMKTLDNNVRKVTKKIADVVNRKNDFGNAAGWHLFAGNYVENLCGAVWAQQNGGIRLFYIRPSSNFFHILHASPISSSSVRVPSTAYPRNTNVSQNTLIKYSIYWKKVYRIRSETASRTLILTRAYAQRGVTHFITRFLTWAVECSEDGDVSE